MNFIYKLFRLDPKDRGAVITVTSGLGVAVNLLIALVKVILGALTASIAIVSEGVNNAADALTSVLALAGSKLARRHPDEKHPFGYGRIEYLSSLVIAVLILVTGGEMLISSVKLIGAPAELSISVLSLIIVAASAVAKYLLGVYTIKMGKQVDSGSLVGVGEEGRNDSFASVITIVSALVFLITGTSIDAYAGILISLLILKTGIEVLRETLSELIGRPGEKELAKKLYKEIRATDGIVSAADMMLHNYGPDSWSGSVNVEIDHSMTVGEVYRFLHALQLRIMHEYKVTLVFGIYAVDNDSPVVGELRRNIAAFVRSEEHVVSYHAVYIDEEDKRIYCDMIVDYRLGDWDTVRERFGSYMKEFYPDYGLELTLETEFV